MSDPNKTFSALDRHKCGRFYQENQLGERKGLWLHLGGGRRLTDTEMTRSGTKCRC